MKIYYQAYPDKNRRLDARCYEMINLWTAENENMPEHSVEEMMNYPVSVLGFEFDLRRPLLLIGHVAVKERTGDTGTIGALVVNPGFRREGVGIDLVRKLIERVEIWQPEIKTLEAFANEGSVELFRQLGGTAALQADRPGPCQYHVILPMNGGRHEQE